MIHRCRKDAMAAHARDLIDAILDDASFRSWDVAPTQPDPSPEYADQLARATERAGVDEAVITGEGVLGGRRVAVAAGEFGFLAGSIGAAAGERLTSAIERATKEGLPLLVSPSSGGTRMQEGTPAFIQMVKIGQAVMEHRAAHLPYIVYLRHPTTGGVLASWGSLGHVTVAEPGALIGFLGPRVRELLIGEPFPEDVQTAENLSSVGVIDGVVPLDGVREMGIATLDILLSPQEPRRHTSSVEPGKPGTAWESVTATRRSDRPGLRELLTARSTRFIPLSGTGSGESDHTIITGLARFGTWSCVLVGQDRRAQQDAELGPAALRVAQRGIRLAEELDLPVVTVIDTPGAELSAEGEEGGLAGEIARCLARLATTSVPVISVVLGEGSGGGALALLPADRTICAEHGWIAPLPPEGASAIIHRTRDRAPEMADLHQIRAADLQRFGAVDEIVAEPDPATATTEEWVDFCHRVIDAVEHHVAELIALPLAERRRRRHRRYRMMN